MTRKPFVLWLTGLSGSGKTTIAQKLHEHFQAKGIPSECLDGDEMRARFPAGFTKEEREAHIGRVAYIASLLEKHSVVVIVSLISPYIESRLKARKMCSNFIEVHVSTPLVVCEKRDVKGLYKKARAGEITSFTGIDDIYEPPHLPEITLDTSSISASESAAMVMDYLFKNGYIK